MLGFVNCLRTGYPRHALYSPHFKPDTSFLYEICSFHRKFTSFGRNLSSYEWNSFNTLLCLLQSFPFKEMDCSIKECQSTLARNFSFPGSLPSPCQQNLHFVNTTVFLSYEKYSLEMTFLLVKKNPLTCNRCPKMQHFNQILIVPIFCVLNIATVGMFSVLNGASVAMSDILIFSSYKYKNSINTTYTISNII